MSKTSIEWTARPKADGSVMPGMTWNPTVGCDRISPGCAHCYAKALHDKRHKAFLNGKKMAPQYAQPFEVLQMIESRLDAPLRRGIPTTYFVNSVSDLFHEDVPDAFIDRVFAVMALAPQHTFQVLTKRAERMRDYLLTLTGSVERMDDLEGTATDIAHDIIASTAYLQTHADTLSTRWPLPNAWLGVSVENQRFADARIPLLLQTPAAVRFISAEPLLGPLNLQGALNLGCINPTRPHAPDECDERALDWVIDGAESGACARDYRIDWSLSLQRQCEAAGVAYFRKQVGQHPIVSDLTHWRCAATLLPDASGYRLALHDNKGGDPQEWPPDLRVRQFPEARS